MYAGMSFPSCVPFPPGCAVQADKIQDKLRTDLLPTMITGWKFWIPAASLNFYAIPLAHQVWGRAA
jgi:hypothetical protein